MKNCPRHSEPKPAESCEECAYEASDERRKRDRDEASMRQFRDRAALQFALVMAQREGVAFAKERVGLAYDAADALIAERTMKR